MELIDTILVSLSYGITLFVFVHSMISDYFYYSLRLDFRRAYTIAIILVFVSSTFNFVSFLVKENFYKQIVDMLLLLSVLSIFVLMEISFRKKYTISVVLTLLSLLLIVISTILGTYSQDVMYGISVCKISYLAVIFAISWVVMDVIKGVRKKDENYISSDVYIGFKQLVLGLLVLAVVFILKIFMDGFLIVSSFTFYGVSFLIVVATLLYSRMNYTFYLRDKLMEENEKFLSLYRSMVDEILVGREIIEKLLPTRKSVKGLDFDKYFKPVVLVGGDFIDIVPLSDSKFIAYISDVSGHGVSAGIISSMLKALTLKEVVEGYSNLPSVVKNLNADFGNLVKDTGRYSTLFITLIDKNKKKFSYVSCGHIDCLYWSSVLNEFFFLSSTAPLLGLFNKLDAYSSDIEFNENDYLILLSDGIFSITSKDGKVLNYDDFITILSRYISKDILPNELIFKVSQEIESFMEGGNVIDDITLFFIKL